MLALHLKAYARFINCVRNDCAVVSLSNTVATFTQRNVSKANIGGFADVDEKGHYSRNRENLLVLFKASLNCRPLMSK